MDIKEHIRNIPENPGIYQMKDRSKKIIYIGKAKNLKKRVSSYFSNKLQDIKTRVLIKKIAYIDFIVLENEIEALILEDNLIKKHLPQYNILMKDDKRYPYLKITLNSEDYPGLVIIRERKNDNDIYFGPYTNGRYLREICTMLNRLFSIRKCSKKLIVNPKAGQFLKPEGKVCLYFQMEQCPAPCQGTVDPVWYRRVINQIILFLKGKNQQLAKELKEEMEQLSSELKFEKARVIRDRLSAIEKIMEKQKIVVDNFQSKDIFYITEDNDIFNITILFIRQGKMVGKDNFIISNKVSKAKKILNDFIKQFYINTDFLPQEIIIPFVVEDRKILEKLLNREKKQKVRIKCPKTEIEKSLIRMAKENSKIELSNYLADKEYKTRTKELKVLKKYLNLKHEPQIIEGFDISNIQGKFAVGSMVRFKDGQPDKSSYRKFKIGSVEGIDDVKMIREIVFRRYKRLLNEKKELPGLVIVDGGKGQLNSAENALKELNLSNLPLVSLAKQEELIFRKGIKSPLKLLRSNPGLKLLQRVRDEAHRFAVSYHRLLRSKKLVSKS